VNETTEGSKCGASFRDPDGFVFRRNGLLLRQINQSYRAEYELLMNGGLYAKLVEAKMLVPHQDAALSEALTKDAFKVIQPQKVPFLSYPYEWCFEQLRQAALLTLSVQRLALEHGMSLKDGSAFNVQFIGSCPVFIDTLSFARWEDGIPWHGYRQFCQHFLAPLLLAQCYDARLTKLSLPFVDGIPLDLTSKLLPWQSWFNLPTVLHLHMQAKLQATVGQGNASRQIKQRVPLKSQIAIIDDLAHVISHLPGKKKAAGWIQYYQDNNYTEAAAAAKLKLIEDIFNGMSSGIVWDLGANTGRFSRLSAWHGLTTIAFDQDEACVQELFLEGFKMKDERCLPLVLDLANPTPATGWQHTEHQSLEERGPADCVMALALVHHLLITCEVSMERIAEFFSKIGKRVIIEFVSMEDSQVKRMLSGMKRSFHPIDQDAFEREFDRYFEMKSKHQLPESQRWLYDYQRRY
jgi:hypothetical protein